MKNTFISKIVAYVLTLMLMFTMIPSGMAFAAESGFEFTLTTDSYSAKTGDVVELTVTVNGLVNDVSMVQYSIQFDPALFSVDTPARNPQKAFDATWYAEISAEDDNGRYSSFFDIAKPSAGQKVDPADSTKKLFNSSYLSMDGFSIDSDSPIYGKTSVVAGKVEFKALADVENVASAFVLTNTAIQVNAVNKPVTTVQIPNINMAKVEAANTAIAAIPATVTYADKAKVEAAKTAYAALGDAEKALVTGADKLTAAETAIAAMDAAITNVETLIAAIGDVIYPDSKDKIDAARAAYDALADDAMKAAVENYTTLTEAEADYAALEANAADVAAAAAVDAKIEAIGNVIYTEECLNRILAAHKPYNELTDAQKALLTKKDILFAAVEKYTELENEVIFLEAEMAVLNPKTITLANKAKVEGFRARYDALDEYQKAAFDAEVYQELVDCETKIAQLEATQERIDAVIAKIEAIGEVKADDASDAKINEARNAYDALLDQTEKDEVTNYNTLLAAEAKFADLVKAGAVSELIAAIGGVTLESGDAITEAEDAYAKLTDTQKGYVVGYNVLTEARATYDELVEEAAQNAANKQAAEAVDAKINAIGEVAYTAESKALIDDAKSAFDALTPAQQALVTKKNVLEDAVAEYKALDDEVEAVKAAFDAFDINNYNLDMQNEIVALSNKHSALDANQYAALDAYYGFNVGYKINEYINENNRQVEELINVKHLIDAIGDVSLDSKAAIEAAEAAYAAIHPEANKKYLDAGKVAILTEAREKYNTLVTYKAAADEVMEDIEALTAAADVTKDNVNTVSQKAASARASYENLPDKTMVADSYLQKLAEVEAACAKVKADLAAAKAVDDVIAAIGTVSLGSLDKIVAAQEAYDALTDDQKAYVENLNTLETARATYDELKADQDAIDAVEALIAAIGDVTLDSECLNTIAAAKDAYDALDADLQPRVENYTVLTNALATYEALVTSKAKIDAVIAAIDNLGEITLASKAKIEAAEALYGALTEDEQAQVENYQILLDARATYEALKEAADKAEADQLAANGVDELIGEIGEVTLNSEAAIIAARAAYDNLTDDQKVLVSGLSILEEAEAILEGLKADKAAIDAVIDVINAIGEVTYPDSKDAIDAAQAAYDELADNLKDQVTNKGVLDNAIAKYEALEADYNAVQNVITLIEQIGDVEYTVECKERIDAAYNAHQALREELRVQVTNTDVLAEAMAAYEALKPTYSVTEEPVVEYGDMYMVVFNNIPEGKKVTLGGVEAAMYTEDDAVYYIVLSSTELNPEEVVVEDGTSASILMGDTNGDGTVDALDAFATNNKSANYDVDSYITDAYAYVRSDINGSGTITAFDALMIARIAAGVQGVVINFVAGK